MAVRGFDDGDRIELSLGNVSTLHEGAVTIAAIAKITTDGSFPTILSCQATSTSRRSFNLDGSDNLQMVTSGLAVASTLQFSTTEDWCLVAITKASGTATPRFHRYIYDTDTWTHQDGGSTQDDDSTTLDHIALGQTNQDFSLFGRVALVGAWLSELTDGQLEGMTDALSDWEALSPDALWPLNQTSVTENVEDTTGGGADQSARVGTSVVTGDDPAFTFDETVEGTGVAALGTLTAAATGSLTVYGTASDTHGMTATATGSRTVSATAAAGLGALVATAMEANIVPGVATAELGALAAVATGTRTRHGTAVAELGALTVTARSSITVMGVAVAALGDLAATVIGERSALPRHILRPPTYSENLWTEDRFWSRYSLDRGTTLAVTGETVVELIYPYQGDLEQYDHVYLGGKAHKITSHEAAILTAAGYGSLITPI